MSGCDAVLHAAAGYSLGPRAAPRVREINARAAEIVLGAAARMGLDAVMHVSSYVALLPPEKPGAMLTTDSPVTRPGGAYRRSKAESEQVARRYQDQGAPRPSCIMSLHSENQTAGNVAGSPPTARWRLSGWAGLVQ